MQRRMMPLALAIVLFAAHAARASDWLQFRGPMGLGVTADKNLPTTWGPKENVLWKTELPGAGASSPIVVGQKIFVTCYSGYGASAKEAGEMKDLRRQLVCLGRDGKILWTREVKAALPETPYFGFQALHGYASNTPVSDGKNVYVFFGKSGVFAFDLEGKQRWESNVGTKQHVWGSGASPVLYKNLLIVNASAESGDLVALKKDDGKVAWTAKGKVSSSWNSPLLVEVPGKPMEVVINQPEFLRGFDLETGAELWKCEAINDYVCPSGVTHDGVIYIVGARANTAVAVRAGGRGDVTKTHLLWTLKKGSNVSSPVFSEGHLYWASESKGMVYCVEANKGKLIYEQPLSPTPGRIYSSPLVGDGKLYYVSREKGTYVLDASPQFRILAHNSLDDSSVFNASPAVSDGQVLLRSDRYLYCLGKASKAAR